MAAVPGSRQWVTVDVRGRSHSTPPSPVTAPSSISARLPGPCPGHLGSSSSSCHFLLMALLSCLSPVVREPGVRVNPFFQFGSVGDVNPQGSSLPPCLGSLWCDAPGSHCAFFALSTCFGRIGRVEPGARPGTGPTPTTRPVLPTKL